MTKIPYPNPYRDPFGGDGSDLTDRCLELSRETSSSRRSARPAKSPRFSSKRCRPMAAMSCLPTTFMPKLRALCDRHGILLVVDEIKVGLGRTGEWFAFQHGGIAADLILLGQVAGRRTAPQRDRRPQGDSRRRAGHCALYDGRQRHQLRRWYRHRCEEIERLELVERSRMAGERTAARIE